MVETPVTFEDELKKGKEPAVGADGADDDDTADDTNDQ
jgi:hypothetical protein